MNHPLFLVFESFPHTDLLSVQRSADSDFSTTRVNRELLQRVSAHDRVAQQIVDGTVIISGCYLEVNKGSKSQVRHEIHTLDKQHSVDVIRQSKHNANDCKVRSDVMAPQTAAGLTSSYKGLNVDLLVSLS